MSKLKEYDCKIYRREIYIAYETVEAASQEEAIRKLEQLDNECDLDFSAYAGHADPAELFVIADETGSGQVRATADFRLRKYRVELLEKAKAVVSLWEPSQFAPALRELDAVLKKILAEHPLPDALERVSD